LLLTSNKILSNTILTRLLAYVGKIIGDYRRVFQLLITVFTFVRDWIKNWGQWHSILTVYRLQKSLWIGQEGSVNTILTEFGISVKLMRLWEPPTLSQALANPEVADVICYAMAGKHVPTATKLTAVQQ
jgi:hypothetical protein